MNNFTKIAYSFFLAYILSISTSAFSQTTEKSQSSVEIKIAFGWTSTNRTVKSVQLTGASKGLKIDWVKGARLEKGDVAGTTTMISCGAGDVDELVAKLTWIKPTAPPRKLAQHNDDYSINGDGMWGYLLEHGASGQKERLKEDSWKQPDAPLLTIQFNKEGTEGFSIALDQLLKEQVMWLPEQDVFITLADQNIDFKQYTTGLKGQRIINLVAQEPDASLKAYQTKWEDFGNPNQWDVKWQTKYMGTRGHLIVTAAAPGSVYKYAIDRWGNVRPDFASPHKFSLDLLWPENTWQQQKIFNGLPVISTTLKKEDQICTIEQFVAPLSKLSDYKYGDVSSVLFTRLNFSGKAGSINFGFTLNKELKNSKLTISKNKGNWTVSDQQSGKILLLLQTSKNFTVNAEIKAAKEEGKQAYFSLTGQLNTNEENEILIKLPSPGISNTESSKLGQLTYDKAKTGVLAYWQNWIDQGAYFEVPEKEINALFNASLWHALVLPRHTSAKDGKLHMDIPYANTAYGQKNADWPINQAVYVDYLLYGLRGYDQVAHAEYESMFDTQQQQNGRIGGFANWGVYSPGQLYAIAQNFLLSRNKEDFKILLPNALKTLDWCLNEVKKANLQPNSTGLIKGPLNDLTHDEREWAFTQAYFVSGLEIFGKALAIYGSPRALEAQKVASEMKTNVIREFSRSSVKSPVVQLQDQTWINFVPTDAMTPRRMMEQWYPTDVDCGPLHLTRLGVFEPYSWLTNAMLNDHEDNLFLKNQGAANEPVYVQQANAYLLRDEPKAVIRAFYSLMACAFSQEQLTSLEHRWAWGQYYGPPSTDGAWFELYRKMLLNEIAMDTLIVGQAIPRPWLESGKQILVKNAPTYFGPVSLNIESKTDEIDVKLNLSDRNAPKKLIIRLRHPAQKPIQSVLLNGKDWTNFNKEKEQIIIPEPVDKQYLVVAKY